MVETTEQWRWAPGYEELYEVSDQGGFRSHTGWHGRPIPYEPKPRYNSQGYQRVTVKRPNEPSKDRSLHQLILEAFVGPKPRDGEGCHNDGDRTNNRLSNLRWDTNQGNRRDALDQGTAYLHYQGVTHCKRGHEFTADNTRYSRNRSGGLSRACRTCDREIHNRNGNARRQARKRAERHDDIRTRAEAAV